MLRLKRRVLRRDLLDEFLIFALVLLVRFQRGFQLGFQIAHAGFQILCSSLALERRRLGRFRQRSLHALELARERVDARRRFSLSLGRSRDSNRNQ